MLRVRSRLRGGSGSGVDGNAYKIFLMGDSITAQNNGSNSEVTGVITGASKANPCVITLTGHAINTGDKVYLFGIQGMSELNENIYTATKIDANSFSVNVNSTGFGTYTGYGRVFRTESGTTAAHYSKSRDGYYTYAEMLSGARFDFRFHHRRGVTGDMTSSMNTRKNYELLSRFNPQIVHILGGRNDINSSIANTTILANIDALISYCTDTLGAKVILGTVTPNDTNSATQKDQQDALNTAIRARASGNVFIADYYTAVADSGTRNWKTGYAKDTQHPSPVGAFVMGQVLRDVIKAKFGYGSGYIANGANVLANPNLTGTSLGAIAGITNNGIATGGWTAALSGGGDSTTRTLSKNGNDEQVMSFNFASGLTNSQTFQLRQTFTDGQLTDDTYYVAEAEISLDTYTGTAPLTQLSLNATIGTALSTAAGVFQGTPIDDIAPSLIASESASRRLFLRTIPAKYRASDTGGGQVNVIIRTNNLSAACSGEVRVHRVQLYPVVNPYI